ncbi:FAD-dependent oxidoreductase [Domibacillus epiphyticus]|uniref:FAD/NAD(P)-binding domain-containing protein n=1 Tax=Domibacillus epiphyticus TaxID=1714355 RepID=A0A1V2ABH9_9BACI|nr:FAD/NAD(P)-binding protein [Domibacillus epiphyticus]OMP68353.1 hypothetical protein BTO28_01660 [Domibacillus epiphyticus]
MYEWVIIGGGIHGCTIANFLVKSGKSVIDDIRIIDPHSEPMARWKRNTNRIGMEYLRSPVVHHIDVHPLSLKQYSTSGDSKDFYGYYKRPQVELFNEHSDNVLRQIHIQKAWHQGTVVHVERSHEKWLVALQSEEVMQARNIVIAISVNEQPIKPEWANKRVYHIFDEAFPDFQQLKGPAVVIGGGITAAHTAIKLSTIFPGKTTMVKRHPFRVHLFDSDPGWLGPKNLNGFVKLKDYKKRRELIKEARHKGSITQELFHKLLRLQKKEELQIVDGEPVFLKNNTIGLKEGSKIEANTVILATGFQPARPNQPWIERLIMEQKLLCSTCGYPIVSESLEWCPHLFVSGPLAELEVGPIARNISGARHAAEKIIASL